MPSRCICCTCGMYRTRSQDRSSVRTNTMFGGGTWGVAGGRASDVTETPIAATSSVTRASRKSSSVESAQLDLGRIVQGNMKRCKLTSALLALGTSTTLFAGVAFAADLGGTDHRDYIRGTTGADTIDAKSGS